MLRTPPREHEAVSWSYVVLCILVIYATIPFARNIQNYVASNYGRQAFYIIVIACVAAATAGMVIYNVHSMVWDRRLIWLLGIAGVWVCCTLQLNYSP